MEAAQSIDGADLRRSVRQFLAERGRFLHLLSTIARRCQATPEATEEALLVLEDLGHVSRQPDDLGGADLWRITGQGKLAFERDPLG